MGWLEPGSDVLTRKAMACKVVLPDLTPVVEFAPPIEPTPAAEPVVESDYVQGSYVGSPLLCDNELEDDKPPDESPIECED